MLPIVLLLVVVLYPQITHSAYPPTILLAELDAAGYAAGENGPYMTIPGPRPGCSKRHHEKNQSNQTDKIIFDSGWTRFAPRRPDRAQNRPRPRHTDLSVARWRNRCRKTLSHNHAKYADKLSTG